MIETNLLTAVMFSDLPGTLPTTWNLSNYIPNGALDETQVLVRIRPVGAFWQAWGPVTSFDNATNVATYTVLIPITEIQFMRSTPRYSTYLDPLATTSRVSKRNLQVNADQGLFVASEWAAQYGYDVYQTILPDPATALNTIGLIQNTQNRWGPDAPWSETSWNFQFSGGYIERSHVRAMVLLSTGWEELTVDPGDPHDTASAPFRFIGEYTLYMDFSTLLETPQGLIVYRYTPRDVHVESLADASRITADGMDPGSRWAFFAAVEIGEELAKRVPACECEQFFTSLIYPLFVQEALNVGTVGLTQARVMQVYMDAMVTPIPTLQSGSLVSVFDALSYENWRDIVPDTLNQPVPTIQSGSLVVTHADLSYENWRDVNPDTMNQPVPTIQSGSTLVVTISYVTYDRRTVNGDTMNQPVPIIQSGTLA